MTHLSQELPSGGLEGVKGPLELLVLQYKVVQAQEGSLDVVCPWISLNHFIQLLKHFLERVQSTMFIFIWHNIWSVSKGMILMGFTCRKKV